MFEEVHREYMVISWKPPLDSGGVDVSNYIIEKRDVNRDIWTTVTSATTKTTCKVELLDGCVFMILRGLKFRDCYVSVFLLPDTQADRRQRVHHEDLC